MNAYVGAVNLRNPIGNMLASPSMKSLAKSTSYPVKLTGPLCIYNGLNGSNSRINTIILAL